MSVERLVHVYNGDHFIDTHGTGVAVGALLEIPFDLVASVGNSAVITDAVGWIPVGRAHRLRGVKFFCTAKAGTAAPTVNVYDSAGTPATILTGAVTLSAAATVYSGVIAAPTTVQAAGSYYTLRVATDSNGTVTNLKAILEIELTSTV